LILAKYFGCFQYGESRCDQIIDIVAVDDCEAIKEFKRLWRYKKAATDVGNGYLFERRGRLILRYSSRHQFAD